MKQSDLPAAGSLPVEPLELCRLIAESMPLMVWTAAADGSTVSCIRRMCAYTGLGASELQGWGWLGALHPDDRARVEQRWRHALATGESYEEEIRLRRHDGAYRWHLDTASPLKDPSGRIVGWLGLCTDIDDRKRASSLADLAAHWYWEQDEQFRFTYFSPDVASIAGSSVDSHLGKTRWELPTIGVTADAWGKHRAMLEAHRPFHDFEFQRVNERGEKVWLSASGVPVFDDAGRFRGYRGIGRNITGRKRAERALRESEERFRALTSLSSDYYWETDIRHRFRVLEYGSRHRATLPKGSQIGMTRWEIRSTSPDEEGWMRHRATLEARQPFRDFELSRRAPDGEERHFTVSGEPMFDQSGTFIGYRGVGREITDRKRVELALRQSSEKYQALVDSIDGIVWEADAASFAMLFVSKQAERLLGYPTRQWIEEPDFWRRHTHPDDVGWAAEFCLRATAQKRNHEFEYRMIAADGRTVWLRDLVTVVVERERVVGLRGVMVDITERKLAAEALCESEKRFRALTSLSSDFFWETDSAHRFRMMEYGEAFPGPMPSADYIGKTRWEMPYAAPDEDGWRRHRAVLEARGPIRGFAFARRARNGEVRHYEVDGDPLFDAGGTFLGYRGVGRDVTERLRAEQALRDSERRIRGLLKRLTDTQEAERRRIAADLHDLVGQNLTALGIGLETLRSVLPPRQSLQSSVSFEELAGLLKDTASAVRQVMADLRPPLLDDYGLLAALEMHARQFVRRAGLRVTVEGAASEPRLAPEIELALFRIAQEALTNAAKHASASCARVRLENERGSVRLSIEDDGVGFAQPAGARAARRGGWGLPVMRERAAEVGGTLHVEFPDRGTRVIVEVPHVDSNRSG